MDLNSDESIAWLASTIHRKLTTSNLKAINVSATARRALDDRKLLGLRVESHLMYGIAQILAQKTRMFATETSKTLKNFDSELYPVDGTVLDTLEASDSPSSLGILSSDFDLQHVIDGFRASQNSAPASPARDVSDDENVPDLSIDDVMRDEPDLSIDDVNRGLSPVAVASPELAPDEPGDETILRDILGSGPAGVDMDWDMDLGISSPPAGSNSEGEDEEEDEQEEAAAPQKRQPARKRKKKLAPVDGRISLQRSRFSRPPTTILASPVSPEEEDADTMRIEDEFFNPDTIAESVKRRRLFDVPQDNEEVGSPDVVPDLEHSDPVLEFNDEHIESPPEPSQEEDDQGISSQQFISSLQTEPEDLERLMAQEVQAARATISSTLAEKHGFNFNHLAASRSARSKAALFAETLTLAVSGDLEVSQSSPYADILVST